jgi:hypothetical protein
LKQSKKYLKYKFSFLETLKNVAWFLWIIFFISLVEILCIELDFGFPILSEGLAKIILNISYAIVASFIFYYFVVILPLTKRNFFYRIIVIRNMLSLNTECFRLKNIFDYKDYSYLEEAFTKEDIYAMTMHKYLKRNDQWEENLKRLKNKIDRIISIIEKILRYEQFLDEKSIFNFEYAIVKFTEINVEVLYYEKKKDFSELASNNIIEALDFIEKAVSKYVK